MSGFLTGVRVLELGGGIAAPFCGRLLADAGADVLKVERPEGDPVCAAGPFAGSVAHPERSLHFLVLSAGKRSIVLDPARAGDWDELMRLIRRADVLVDDRESSTLARWKLEPEHLERANPRLVHATISPFGGNGPYHEFKAEELTLYALGGLMYHIGAYHREPLKHGSAQAAYLAGLSAAAGAHLALLARDHDGLGQQIDISTQECLALLLGSLELSQYAYAGGIARREEKTGPGLNNIQPCANGHVVPIAFSAPWEMMAHVLDAPELLDPRFRTVDGRQQHMAALTAIMWERLGGRGRYELFHSAQALGPARGVVQGPADLARCPQLEARGFWAAVDHALAGRLRLPGPSSRASRTPACVRGPAPLLGEHTNEAAWNDERADEPGTAGDGPRSVATIGPAHRPSFITLRFALPLAGMRVIDSSRAWAMPFVTGLLSDMGAEVIKVEVPTYLDTREAEPFLHNTA